VSSILQCHSSIRLQPGESSTGEFIMPQRSNVTFTFLVLLLDSYSCGIPSFLRFAKDIDTTDNILPWNLRTLLIYVLNVIDKLRTCLTAAQDRKGLTPVVVACNIKLSFLHPSCAYQCFKRRNICVMLQCFPALIISKLKPVSCVMLILAS
jgi:hypothetical protein